jgi:rod shape determining protein RodA
LLLIPFGLVLVQPDLGTAVVILCIGLAILFFSAVDLKKMAILGVCAIAVLPLFYSQLEGYQKQRLTSFMDPESDPQGSGYNQIQAEIAVGSGNVFGRGWGRGTQSHLQFLPEQHTDFIFATFAEEFGFLGSMVILILFAVLIGKSTIIALRTSDQFLFSVAIGVIVFFTVQFFVNVGMNIGILPIAGLPLPFVSYGGSSLIATLIGVGMVESVAIQRGN